jgi:hypothetical protein
MKMVWNGSPMVISLNDDNDMNIANIEFEVA